MELLHRDYFDCKYLGFGVSQGLYTGLNSSVKLYAGSVDNSSLG